MQCPSYGIVNEIFFCCPWNIFDRRILVFVSAMIFQWSNLRLQTAYVMSTLFKHKPLILFYFQLSQAHDIVVPIYIVHVHCLKLNPINDSLPMHVCLMKASKTKSIRHLPNLCLWSTQNIKSQLHICSWWSHILLRKISTLT